MTISHLRLQPIGFEKDDGQQDRFVDKNEQERKWQWFVVAHWADDLERSRHETNENINDGDEHDHSETFVGHVDQFAG